MATDLVYKSVELCQNLAGVLIGSAHRMAGIHDHGGGPVVIHEVEQLLPRDLAGFPFLRLGGLSAGIALLLSNPQSQLGIKPDPGKEAVVFLPDHGFFAAVRLKQMWDLEPRFTRLPFQAFAASLPIQSPGLTDRWSPEAVKVFKEAVSMKVLLAQISSASRDSSHFPALSVEFSALFSTPTRPEEGSYAPSMQGDAEDIARDRDKLVSVVDLMVDKCRAKRKY